MLDMAIAVFVPPFVNVTAELYLEVLIRARHHPHFARIQPLVGHFHLHMLEYLLLEQTVLVANGKAHCGIVERRKRIHKARSETTETAVSETGIVLHFVKVVEIVSVALQSVLKRRLEPEIIQIVFERTTYEKLHAKVVNAFEFALLDPLIVLLFFLE